MKMKISEHEFRIIDASTFGKRLVGLMGKKELQKDEAMRLMPCSSIHTCFMKFAIDVVFLDKKNKVVDTIKSLPPWKFNAYSKSAYQVVEMAVGAIERAGIKKNMVAKFEDLS
ncbi:MAG: DUF192 domain-containing protein [Clostridia bacterium]|mgnify:CR=1 FL=1|jgi:uncharacterized protein|nr:DUF192 domain-containing protein [Clostridia bacterium]